VIPPAATKSWVQSKRDRVRDTGFEPVADPLVVQELTKDGTQNSTHVAAYQSLARIVEAWAFLPIELQHAIVTIVEQHVQLSLGRPARSKPTTTTREQERTEI